MVRFEIDTQNRTQFLEITQQIRGILRQSKLISGAVVVYCPHTTAGLTIQENADPDVIHDMLLWLNQHVPKHVPGFRHGEGNSDAHIKSSLIGSSVTLLVEQGELVLGTWQGVYFCEFDGPRRRFVHVQLLQSPV